MSRFLAGAAPRTSRPSTDELDLVALALSNHVPLYGRIADRIAEIPQADMRRGMFWGGATRSRTCRAKPSSASQ